MNQNTQSSIVVIDGAEALSFLHRLSTGDVANSPIGSKCLNCIVNEKGRMVDLVQQEIVSSTLVKLRSSHPDTKSLVDFLNSYHFMESLEIKTIEGSSFGFGPKDERIELLRPGFPNEINDQFNPLEINLKDTVSFDKGCYIGQEVLAKLENLNKLKRKLVGIVCDVGLFSSLHEGMVLEIENEKVGVLTSKSNNFHETTPIALAVVKTKKIPENRWVDDRNWVRITVTDLQPLLHG